MLHLALTPNQAYAQSWLADGDKVPYWYLETWEWDELKALMELQFENNFVYAAVLDAGFEPLACEVDATQAADMAFEDSANSERLINEGWMQR